MLKVTVSTILSIFLNQNFSPKLEQIRVKIHLKQPKTPKSSFHEIFRGKRVRKQLGTCRIGLLMKMSSVGKSNRGRIPTLTEKG